MTDDSQPSARGSRTLFDDRPGYVDRFGLLLSVTVASIVILSLIDMMEQSGGAADQLGAIAASILVAATLLLALRASGLAHRWQRFADIVVLVTVVALAVATLASAQLGRPASGESPAPLVLVGLAAVAPLVVIRRLLQHRRITRGTLQGAVSAYLLIPIAFFYAFLAVGNFQGPPFFGQVEPTTSFMYYSLSVITTLGFGDLTSTTELGRLLSVSEAIVGQIYLITFVAMLVSLFAQQWRSMDPADAPDE
ncbi:MAG: hypothetical protein IPO93_08495 [Actinobacteria bacterium]|jgi:hypothetical protein|nr:hypothetical protein [Actinomycetota bacterium]